MYNLSIHFIVYSPIDTFQDFLIAHETTYAYNGNKHFFDKSCHRQTFQNSKISCQKMCSNLLKIWSFQKNANINICAPKLIFFKKKKGKIRIIFDIENSLWKSEIGIFCRLILEFLVGLTMTWFSEEMLIYDICIRGFMCSAIKKSCKVSTLQWPGTVFLCYTYVRKTKKLIYQVKNSPECQALWPLCV